MATENAETSKRRIDELNGRGYRIIQDRDGFCFGQDAVLLSAFATVKEGERVIDLGTGTGVIPILLEAKTRGAHFTGLELQREVADMAAESVELNGIGDRVDIVRGDIRQVRSLFKAGQFDVVTGNPPYKTCGSGLISPNEKKAISRTEIMCTLGEFVAAAAYLLPVGGRFYMVHRPGRLPDIFRELETNGFGIHFIRFVHPYEGRGANLVLVEGIRGAKNNPQIEPPLFMGRPDGSRTEETEEIYFKEKLMDHAL